jgi:hypothetical protein
MDGSKVYEVVRVKVEKWPDADTVDDTIGVEPEEVIEIEFDENGEVKSDG